MTFRSVLSICALLMGGIFAVQKPALAQYEKLSPFQTIRWEGESPEVEIESDWYRLVSIDGQETKAILDFCKKTYRGRWAKRFCEDLVQVLSEMGHPPEGSVKLVVIDVASGEKRVFPKVRMTHQNRQRIRNADPRPGVVSGSVNRVDRKHTTRPDRRFRFLTQTYWEEEMSAPRISADKACEDLDQLEWALENKFSYLALRKVDYKKALDTVRASLGKEIAKPDFHIQLRKLVALFGDGHSRVRGVMGALPPGFAPVRFADFGGRLVALHYDKDELKDDEHPYVVALDRVPVADWLEVSARLGAQGSPQLIRRESIYYLSWINAIRKDLGLPEKGRVEITLESEDGKRSTKIDAALQRVPRMASVGLPDSSKILDGNIGYMRISTMSLNSAALEELRETMESFAKTDGLIIDVRGNGGGRRDALRLLFPFLMREDDAPYVANVGAYRLPPDVAKGNAEGYLENRYLFPATSSRWSKEYASAFRSVAKGFKPEWKIDGRKFSDWHYLVLSRKDSDASFSYERPVVVLIDQDCYSATDIFVGAFKGWRNVRLVGAATGGGSGRSQEITLVHSRLAVRLSTMASFQRDGSLYDGNGIHPDVIALPSLDDFLRKSDSVLEKAIALLQGS